MKHLPDHSPTASKAAFGRAGLLAVLMGFCLLSSPSFAKKPDWTGGGKPGKEAKEGKEGRGSRGEKAERGGDHGGKDRAPQQDGVRVDVRIGGYFADSQRQAAQVYFGNEYKAGRCPPGLAKKNNGCLPPGQAKRYSVGQPLPSSVIYYSVPQSVVVQLGVPPAGHRYVRVAADILLTAVGTGMVIDAIGDLGRM